MSGKHASGGWSIAPNVFPIENDSRVRTNCPVIAAVVDLYSWHLADVDPVVLDVRYWGQSGPAPVADRCRLLTQPGHRQPMGLPQFSSGALPIFDVARQNAGHFPEHRDWQ